VSAEDLDTRQDKGEGEGRREKLGRFLSYWCTFRLPEIAEWSKIRDKI
jgi:hypothetical protein